MITKNHKTSFAPELFVNNGVKDISFYEKAFGASEQMRFSNDDGSQQIRISFLRKKTTVLQSVLAYLFQT
jgi:uncharacterized glyoxalase superfamily protein PhnB